MLKLKYLSVLAFLFVGMLVGVNAQKIKFNEFDLDNGLHVILHQDNSKPIVNVSVMYNVGSKNEDPKLTGFAHFFEHLMFEGSKNIGRGQYAKYVEKAGGELNANTSQDRTYYYETLPSNQLKLGLWLESERMMHARVDSIGIATQKKVVAEEKKERLDNTPYGDFLKVVCERAFKKHPYRWVTIGDVVKLVKAKDEDFVNFYKTYYVPNNACLVVAGDIDVAKAKKMVSDYFSAIPKGTRKMRRPDVFDAPQTAEICDTVYRAVQLPMIINAYHVPPVKSEDTYAINMLINLLTGSKSSRMNKEIIDKQQKAVQVRLINLGMQDPGLVVSYAIPSTGVKNKDLQNAMDDQLAKVRNELISKREFQKLKNQYESSFIGGNTSMSTIGENLARNYTYFKNTDLINKDLQKYMSVTRKDIQRVAKKYFIKKNRLVVYYLPKADKKTN